ncbi:MAG: hypothetical protein KJ047_13090 [Anaerolineae bacterium]|nr:hypothetical protein [Anaerolineae bacterium]MEB2287510.1 hypothetical protein [Anaerolineae bacterium]
MKLSRLGLWLFGCALALTCAACGGDAAAPAPRPEIAPQETETPPYTAPFATLSPVLIGLQRSYEALSDAHASLTRIWEGLARGEQVRCGEMPFVPDPAGISHQGQDDYANLAALLRRAAIDLTRNRQLWQAECATTRPIPPASVISEGLLSVRSAGDFLREAGALLGVVQ